MRIMDTFTKEEIAQIVQSNTSYTECLRKMGYSAISGDTLNAFKNKLKDLDINTTRLNQYIPENNFIKRTDNEVFKENSEVSQNCLRNHYKSIIKPTKCTICNQVNTWNNQELIMILDHINGNNHDNRLENLRWVCPNCNSQLPTTSARNPNRKNLTICKDCGKPISKGAIRCMDCKDKWKHNPNNPNKITDRPNRNELKNLIRTTPFTTIGKMYGVDGNSVKKWCIWEHLPHLRKDIKSYSDEDWNKI